MDEGSRRFEQRPQQDQIESKEKLIEEPIEEQSPEEAPHPEDPKWWYLQPSPQPFRAEPDLQLLKYSRPLEKDSPTYELERRAYRMKIEEYKRKLLSQKEAVINLVHTIRGRSQNGVQISATELRELAQQAVTEGRISIDEAAPIERGIQNVWTQQEAVRQAHEQYPEPNDLFRACFMIEPIGKVDLVRSGLSINFVLDRKDFDRVANLKRNADGTYSVAESSTITPSTTLGTAFILSKPPIEGLEQAVTIIARDSGVISEQITTEIIDQEERTFPIHGQGRFSGGSFFDEHRNRAVFVTSSRDGVTTDFIWASTSRPGEQSDLHKYRRIQVDDAFTWQEYTSDDQGNETIVGTYNEITTPLDPQNPEAGMITISDEAMTVHGDGSKEINAFEKVAYVTYDDTKLHEEQHHINKMFKPHESNPRENPMNSAELVATRYETADEQLQALVERIANYERRRQLSVTTRGRDELLAMLAGGDNADFIEATLTLPDGPYDYARTNHSVSGQRWQIVADSHRFYADLNFERKKQGQPELNQEGFSRDDFKQRLIEAIDHDWSEGYFEDVKEWCGAVKRMEAKGYSRDEVVDILYTEPTKRWVALSRRLPDQNPTTSQP
ncbi:hypothetical protein HGA91_03780 [candidate division WWE3 bacterium]|nr:hypothetical protein [candidate division WWE3 bacterium]